MPETTWKKVVSEKAADIVGPTLLDAAAMVLLKPEMRPEAFIAALADAERWPDAVKVMSRTLPPREAVWWACVCARQMTSLTGEADIAALEAAEKWVYKPTEGNREAAFRLVQESSSRSAGTLAASAAAFSAGNLPLEGGHRVELDAEAFPAVIEAVVMVSATEKKGREIHARLKKFLRSGEDIACGGNGRIEEPEGTA